jgi:intraflagellar transport protein 140
MRALIHSGDVERIIIFANVARSREVYILAADYLKSLDWKRYPDALQNIMNFYKKARAYEKLAQFYDIMLFTQRVLPTDLLLLLFSTLF